MSRAVVSITKCPDYDLDRVRAAMSETLDRLPGMGGLVKGGDLVVLKPNLLSSNHGPDAAINTHPAFVRAATEWFRARDCRVVIGDSCGSVAPGAKSAEKTSPLMSLSTITVMGTSKVR